jgi:hypothetical protein
VENAALQFQSHMRHFRDVVGEPSFAYRHWQWVQAEFIMFARLLQVRHQRLTSAAWLNAAITHLREVTIRVTSSWCPLSLAPSLSELVVAVRYRQSDAQSRYLHHLNTARSASPAVVTSCATPCDHPCASTRGLSFQCLCVCACVIVLPPPLWQGTTFSAPRKQRSPAGTLQWTPVCLVTHWDPLLHLPSSRPWMSMRRCCPRSSLAHCPLSCSWTPSTATHSGLRPCSTTF